MNEYIVYFEIFGKKLKTKIIADSEKQAKEMIKEKIIFHKIEKSSNPFNNIFDDIFKNLK